MPPAIVVAAVAIGASAAGALGVISITAAVVIATTATVAGTLLTQKSIPSLSGNVSQQERKQVLRSAAAAQTIIYGRTMTSGLLFFTEEQGGEQDENEWVHLAIALCGHPIDGVDGIWLGDDEFTAYPSDRAQWELHSDRTTPDPFMLQNCPSWKEDMIGRGITWVRVSLKFDQKLFPAGIPNIKLLVRGKKVYDPRSGQTIWSDNVPLIVRDYLSWVCEVPSDDLDDSLFIQGANIADEMVAAGNASEKRYRMSGIINADDSRSSVLDDMCLACAGEMTYIAGRHGVIVGAYYGPATMVLSADQVIGNVSIVPESSYSDKINTVTGIFIDPGQGYIEADYPAVKVQSFIDKDGGEFSEDLKLKFVNSEFQSQRLAQIKINRKRLGRTIKLKTNMYGYRYRPAYYVYLDLPMLGINMQEFRVSSWSLDVKGGVDLVLRQETPAVWIDAVGQPIDRPDLTDLPTSQVAPPYNLAYQTQEIGEVVQGILTWTNATEVAYNRVVIRNGSSIVMTVQVPGNLVRLTGLLRGQYTASVTAVSYAGVSSNDAFLSFDISAPSPPSGADISMGYFQATITPRSSNQQTSIQYDFWTSGEVPLPNTNTPTVESGANRLYTGKQYTTSSDLQVDHTYHFYIRATNAFGTSSFAYFPFTYTFASAGLIQLIDNAVRGSQTFKNLAMSAEQNYQAILENALANDGSVRESYKSLDYMGVKIKASYIEITTLIAKNDQAYAQQFSQLQASYGSLSSTVQQTSTAIANMNGKLSAQWGIKLQVNQATGNRYVAGIQLGLEADGGAVQSIFAVRSDIFAVYSTAGNTEKLAFSTKNGQVFLSEGIFDYASISLAKIGSWYSSNYVAGRSGTIMRSDGSMEMYGGSGSAGGVVLNNTGIAAYDTNGVERVKLGQL